jgi:hypothetical protein
MLNKHVCFSLLKNGLLKTNEISNYYGHHLGYEFCELTQVDLGCFIVFIFYIDIFFQFHHLPISLLEIEFYNLLDLFSMELS